MKKLENNQITLTNFQLMKLGLKFRFKFFLFKLRNFRDPLFQPDDAWLKS
jgi:hypothetical protein